MFPTNDGPNVGDAARAQALGLGDHLVSDIHDGYTGAVEMSEQLFQVRQQRCQPWFPCLTLAFLTV